MKTPRKITESVWRGMKNRCFNPKDTAYIRYRGRGITVCEGWLVFENFLFEMGTCPRGMSIDRFPDNDAHYSCGRCGQCAANGWSLNARWATRQQQMANTRQNVWITFNGHTRILEEWSRITGVEPTLIRSRLKKGLSPEEALAPAKPISPLKSKPRCKRDWIKHMEQLEIRRAEKRRLKAVSQMDKVA